MANQIDIPLGLKLDKLNNDLRIADSRITAAVQRLEKTKKFQLSIETNLTTKKISELRTIHQNLLNRFNKLVKLDVDVATLERAKGRIETVEKIFRNLNQELKETPKNSENAVDKMAKFGMIVTGLNQAHQLMQQLSADFMQMVNSGAEVEVLRSTFKGTTDDIQLFRQATAGTVTEANLIKLSNQATNLGVSLHDQVILFAMVEAAGDEMGISLEESFQQAVYATEGNERGLKSLGIQKEKYQEIVNDMAKVHGDEINNLDAETQKQIRLNAIIQASGMTYEEAINNAKDKKDKLEALGVTVEETKVKFGNLISLGLIPVIDALVGTGEAGQVAFGGIVGVGGAIVPLIPQILQLKTMQKLLAVETAAATTALNAEAVAAGAASVASKGFLLTLGSAIAIVGAVATATYLYTERINDNTEAIRKNREEALKQHPEADKSGFGGKTLADEKEEEYNKRSEGKPLAWLYERIEKEKQINQVVAEGNKHLKTRAEIEEEIESLQKKQKEEFAPGTPGDIKIQKEIDALQAKLDINKNIKSSTKQISELERHAVEGLSKSSDTYYNYKFDLIQKEVDAFYKAGIDETLIMEYVNETFTKLDDERHKAVLENLNQEIAAYQKLFDEDYIKNRMKQTGGIEKVKAAGEVDLIPKKLKPVEVKTSINDIRENVKGDVNEVTEQDLWEEENKFYLDSFKNMTSSLSSEWAGTLDEMFSGSVNFSQGVTNLWQSLGNSVVQQIERIAAEYASIALISGIGSLIPGLGGFMKIFDFLSGRAEGGPVAAGTPYKVGERGTELFIPEKNGYIISNDITKQMERLTTEFDLSASIAGLSPNDDSFDFDISKLSRRVNGGPVTAGTPYKVGERGTELFISEKNGYIIPNDALQSNSSYGFKSGEVDRLVNTIKFMSVNVSRTIKKYNTGSIGIYGELASSNDIYVSNRNQEKVRKRFGG